MFVYFDFQIIAHQLCINLPMVNLSQKQ